MNLLQIAQAIAREVKEQEIPNQIVGNNKPVAKQILEAVTLSIASLARSYPWQELQKEYNFNSVISQESYTLPSDFSYMINNTFYNTSQRRELIGSISPQEWRQLKNTTASGINQHYRIRGNDLLIYPNPTSVNSYTFEYVSKNIVKSSNEDNQFTWLADTDTPIIDDYILRLDTTWRVLSMQGKKYAEVKAQTDFEIQNRFASNTPKRTIYTQSLKKHGKTGYPSIINRP